MTAHITKIKGGYEVAISPTVRLADWIYKQQVQTKREARAIAAARGAQPWNF